MNKLTVLLTVYDTEPAAMLEALKCLLAQDYSEKFEIILIDDGSTKQSTLSMVDFIGQTYASRVTVMRVEHGGSSTVYNAGLAKVTTPYAALMHDDIFDTSKLRLQMQYMKKHPETDVLGTNLFSFYDDDLKRKPIYISQHKEKPVPREKGNRFWLVNNNTIVCKPKSILDAGGYTKSGRAQDVELWSRMYPKGYIFRNVTEVMCGWRHYRYKVVNV
jgi:glycosyltransferase involved in cell wall biosynthesis